MLDTLSRLTFVSATKLLGADGDHLIAAGGKYDIDITTQVKFDQDRFRLAVDSTTVTLALSPAARNRLEWHCDTCEVPCEHAGAAFSLILEEKLALGLADARPEREPRRKPEREALVAQALAERKERGRTDKMRLASLDPQEIWADYTITNAASGKTYRVALRGWRPGESYCSCPDFRKNTLGTCKHILHALEKVRRRFPDSVRDRPYLQRDICVHLFLQQGAGAAHPAAEPARRQSKRDCNPIGTDPSPIWRTCSNASGDSKGSASPSRCIRMPKSTFKPGSCSSVSPPRSPTFAAIRNPIRCARRC